MLERLPPNRGLTSRQMYVAKLVALDCTDKEIADELGIALETVKRHLSDIRVRLNVRTRTGIATWVAQQDGHEPSNYMHNQQQ